VPQQCLDQVLRWQVQFERLDRLDGSEPLAEYFRELSACRGLVVGHRASEAEKRAIIPRVERCLNQFRAVVEGLLSSMAS
jgi:hypothetical protein